MLTLIPNAKQGKSLESYEKSKKKKTKGSCLSENRTEKQWHTTLEA